MERRKAMEQLKFLYDQVHQTAERREHLEERMPLHVHPESLNYGRDLMRVQGDYNRLSRTVRAEGAIDAAAIAAEGLPVEFDLHKD